MIKVRELRSDLSFGSRVTGVTYETLDDAGVREELQRIFEDRGLIVFEDMEPSSKMHVTLSNVFGTLKDHPVPSVDRVDAETRIPPVVAVLAEAAATSGCMFWNTYEIMGGRGSLRQRG